jgi:hypothetical protein
MKPANLLLWLAAVVLVAAGCMPEDLGGGLDIVNETDQRLYNYDEVIPPNGGRWRYATSDCSNSDLTVRTKDGAVFAELTEEWCPGQTWTITGKGESTLEDR